MTLSELFEGLWIITRDKVRAFWREDSTPKSKNRHGEESLLLVPIPAARSKLVFFLFFVLLVCVVLKAFWLQCGISTDFLKKQISGRTTAVVRLHSS